jgi:carbon-monoxide dehydrogenase large subunit
MQIPSGADAPALHRLEDDRLLRGEGAFVDDMTLPGMLHAAIVRSTHAHARIVSIDAAQALALPGVVTVLTADAMPGVVNAIPPIARENLVYENAPGHPILARGGVSYVGQAIAIAVAQTRYGARDAAERVLVTYDPLPASLDAREASRPGAAPLHEGLGNNVAYRIGAGDGDVDASFRAADRIVQASFDVPRIVAAPIEGRGVLASYDADAQALTLWTSTQVPHRVKEMLAILLDPPPRDIRVVGPYVGGGFGQKGEVFPEEIALSHLTMTLGRPVKWIEDRSENMIAYHGRGFAADIEAGVMNDGRILGMRYRIWGDIGAYLLTFTVAPSHNVVLRVVGPYAIPNMDVECLGVLTNKSPTGPYRGAGGPEACLFTERMMDLIAREIGLDPVELRRRNLLKGDVFPYRTTTGLVYDSGDYAGAIDRALELADYDGWRDQQRQAREDGRLIGIGIATAVKASGGKGLARSSNAIVRVTPKGKVEVVTEISPIGQGTRTTFAQLAASALGVEPAGVDVQYADTSLLAWGLGTFASRGVAVGGSAVYEGLRLAREKLAAVAAHLLECSVGEIVFGGGNVYSAELPDKRLPFAEVASAAHDPASLPAGMNAGVDFAVDFTLPENPHSFAAHVAVVEVDPGSGALRILEYVAVHDCGPFLNPIIAKGQIDGAIVQGLGQALSEVVQYDAIGQLMTANLMSYGLPVAADVPPFVTDNLATPSPTNPLGMKGIGELPTVPAPAVIANALDDALAPIGASRIDLPLTPEKVWRAIRGAAARRSPAGRQASSATPKARKRAGL